MQVVTKAVNHKGNKVGEVEVPQYESIEEIQENESPEEIIRLFNKAKVVDLQGKERNKHAEGRQSKTAARRKAFNLLTPDEIAQFQGDFDAMQTFLDSDEMAERIAAA